LQGYPDVVLLFVSNHVMIIPIHLQILVYNPNSRLGTHPFDTIKVRMQLSGMGVKATEGAAVAAKEGIMTVVSRLVAQEGFFTLYKG
jgi:hypothetical protein